jgi:carbonic anhydrase/acetyltransferase-like protein (isoleucine patch superfamily)
VPTATRFEWVNGRRVIAGDWYPGAVPDGAQVDATAYVGSSYSFERYRSELPVGVQVGRGASLCDATSLDIGPCGVVRLGECALVTAARIVCDQMIEIGDHALVSWDVVLMDAYRVPLDPAARKRRMQGDVSVAMERARPIRIGHNSWIGFGACVLPGVTVGDCAIVAARSVVAADVPPYVVVAGNPARIVRRLTRGEIAR